MERPAVRSSSARWMKPPQSRFSDASFGVIGVSFERLAVVHQAAEGLKLISVVRLDQTLEFLSRLIVKLDLEGLHSR